MHGANLTGNVTGAAKVREHRKEIAFQLWALRHIALDSLTAPEMAFVWSGVEHHAHQVLSAANSYFVEVADISAEDRLQADALVAEADELHAIGDVLGETRATLRALAWDPYRLSSRTRLTESVAQANAAEHLPHPLQDAREFVVLADAEALLADCELLAAFADTVGGCERVTLAIDASRLPLDRVSAELHALVDRCGLSDRHDIDLLAVTGPLPHARSATGC